LTEKAVLIDLHYLPSISYFNVLASPEQIFIERHENFVKQSYRNRCHINTSQGKTTLIIPLTAKHGKTSIKDVKIDHGQKWLNNHWRTIQTAYGNAPFFEFYAHDLNVVLFKKFDFLYDLNYNLLSMCLKWLKWKKPIQETMAYNQHLNDILDLRNVINVKKKDENNEHDKIVPYTQVFGNKFVTDLSIIDLVFCVGPQANKYITPS
jgi:hypothetical protein